MIKKVLVAISKVFFKINSQKLLKLEHEKYSLETFLSKLQFGWTYLTKAVLSGLSLYYLTKEV